MFPKMFSFIQEQSSSALLLLLSREPPVGDHLQCTFSFLFLSLHFTPFLRVCSPLLLLLMCNFCRSVPRPATTAAPQQQNQHSLNRNRPRRQGQQQLIHTQSLLQLGTSMGTES